MPYYIYRIEGHNKYKNFSYHYIGSTPNPKRRLRQHNNKIVGGAKCTHSKLNMITNNEWYFQWLLLTCLPKDKALSLEWNLKHPLNKDGTRKRKNNYFCENVNIMLYQIDITIKYFFNKWHNINLDKYLSLLVDIKIKQIITYKPINYKIHYFYNLNENIIDGTLINQLQLIKIFKD